MLESNALQYWLATLLILALLAPLSTATPDEASGIVTRVIDGDILDVQDFGTVRLADVDCPETNRPGGQETTAYTSKYLLGNRVFLDIDNKSVVDNTGGERYVCVVYMIEPNGTLTNFNKMLADSGNAYAQDCPSNEFNPADWWGGQIPATVHVEQVTGTPGAKVVPGLSIPEGTQFVGSKQSNKYHIPSCRWATRNNPENEIWFANAEEAKAKGYEPCGVCYPH